LEEPSIYNSQTRIIKGCSTRFFSLIEEVMTESRDLNVFMQPLKEHSIMKSIKA